MKELLQIIKRKWKVLQILSDPENISLFERMVNERKIKMKTIQELLALKRELEASIDNCQRDTTWQEMAEHSQVRITVLKTRLSFINDIIDNFTLYDWIFNSNTGIKRVDLISPSNIEVIDGTRIAETTATPF